MAISLSPGLPASALLEYEGVHMLSRAEARRRGALHIGLVNLMPGKAETEYQFARLLGSAQEDVELTLLVPGSYKPRHTPADHLAAHYLSLDDVRGERFDGIIVTGAPVERRPFQDVSYWPELTTFFDWVQAQETSAMFVCWGGLAALHHYHGVEKNVTRRKLFGVYDLGIEMPGHPLFNAMGPEFPVPCSRHARVWKTDVEGRTDIEVLAGSPQTGPSILGSRRDPFFYVLDHLEYEAHTLRKEYLRDLAVERGAMAPVNYFPDKDPAKLPDESWHPHGRFLYRNWLNLIRRLSHMRSAA